MIAALLLACYVAGAWAEETEALKAFYNPAVSSSVAPEHEPEGDDYFTDAVFIGDSMMEYIEMYELLPTANFVWQIGMSPMSVGRRQFRVKDQEEKITTFEQAALYRPRKLYIFLGMNGLDIKSAQLVLNDYEKLADDLIAFFPNALIYVISPTPMTYDRMTKEHLPVSRYENFENMLRQLAERRYFYYIDMYHMVADEEGYLPNRYSVGDGFHLSKTAYSILADYIRTHTVEYPAPEQAQEGGTDAN